MTKTMMTTNKAILMFSILSFFLQNFFLLDALPYCDKLRRGSPAFIHTAVTDHLIYNHTKYYMPVWCSLQLPLYYCVRTA